MKYTLNCCVTGKVWSLVLLCSILATVANGQLLRLPQAGDVFRDYSRIMEGNWTVASPTATHPDAQGFLPNPVIDLTVDDLQGAIRAEFIIDFWGGHPGTQDKKFRFNGHDWIPVPLLPHGGAIYYMQQVNWVVDVPLTDLLQGNNTFEGTCGAQDFGFGLWGWNQATLRVYYNPASKTHPTGSITSHSNGATFEDSPTVTASGSGGAGVSRVDFFAYFDGYDPDGDGRYNDWQVSYHRPAGVASWSMSEHVGSAITAPFNVVWDTSMVPDQPAGGVKLIAHIRDANGYVFVTSEVNNLTLLRTNSSVRIYRTSNFPSFWVRNNTTNQCSISIPNSADLGSVTSAHLLIRSWYGFNFLTTTKINSYTTPLYGANSHFSYDKVAIPASALVHGVNTFMASSSDSHHGTEIHFPGPALLISYSGTPDTNAPSTPTALVATPISNSRMELNWTASTDNRGINFYRVRRNGVEIGTTEGPYNSFTDSGLTASTAYSYAVLAVDRSSNESTLSASANGSTLSAAPLPTTGLTLWLRGDAGVLNSNSTVTQWTDQSGNNRHATQGASGSKPTRHAGVLNGLPTVRFDGANDSLSFQMPVNGLNGMSIFLVAANTANLSGNHPANHAALFWNETAPWGTIYLTPYQSQVSFRFGTTQPENLLSYARPASVGNAFTLTTAIKDTATDSLYVAGAPVLSQGGKLSTIAGCRDTGDIGRGLDDNTYFGGDIAEVVIYDRALSPAERQTVEAYLNSKYQFVSQTPLEITVQPTPVTVTEPNGANFSVEATGAAPLSYQWLRNGNAIPSATGSSYSLVPTSLAADHGAQFKVVVSNASGSVTSVVAALTVIGSGPQPPSVVTAPTDLTVIEPQGATFSVTATGTAPLSYRWYRNNVALGGATGTSYTLTPTARASDNGAGFKVVISNAVGSVTSVVATLTVLDANSVPPNGLALWLRGDAGTILNGSAVTQWTDQSGNNRHATAALANDRPLLAPAALNGHAVIRFDGLSDYLTFNLPVNGRTAMSIFLVAARSQNQVTVHPAASAPLFWNESNGWGTVFVNPFQADITARFGTMQADNTLAYTRPESAGTDFSVTTALKNGTTDSLYVNGSLVLSESGKLSTIAGCRDTGNLGRGYNDDSFFAGDIAEVLVYDRALSSIERQAVETYLDSKYQITPQGPPVVTTQPTNVTVEEPEPASFSAVITGSLPVIYQWQRGGVNIAGATNSSYTLTPTSRSADHNAQFRVRATNILGAVTSQVATLTVNLATPHSPSILTQPANLAVVEPNPASFSVSASGTAPLFYQWQRNGVSIPGATSSNYTLVASSVSGDNGAQFRVVVTNFHGSVTSHVATLTVISLGSIPTDQMRLWLRADAGIVQDGAGITRWNDQSGQNRHAQQAGANSQPSLIINNQNGLPAVHFDGINDYLSFLLPVNGLSGMTIFMVAANRQNQTGGSGPQSAALFWNENQAWSSVHLSPFQSRVNLRFGTAQAGNQILYARPANIGSDFSLTTAIKDGTTDSLFVNRATVVTATGKLSTIVGCRDTGNVGRGYDDNTFYNGDIAEVLIYARALTPAERLVVEEYLDSKYLVSSPAPPQIVTVPSPDATVGLLYQYFVSASGSPAPTYQLLQFPTGMSIVPATGVISWTPNGAQAGFHSVTVRASNAQGETEQSFVIEVGECPANIVSYWPLDDASGILLRDSVRMNHVVCSEANCPTPTAGLVGGAMAFTANPMIRITAPAHPSFDFGNQESFSLEVWVRTETLGETTYFGRIESGTFMEISVGQDENARPWFFLRDRQNNILSTVVDPNPPPPLGTWRHVVGVRDAAAAKAYLYVDGVLVKTVDTAGFFSGDFSSPTAGMDVGWINHSHGFQFGGRMDEMALYRRALSVTEVQSHRQSGLNGIAICTSGSVAPQVTQSPSNVTVTQPAAATFNVLATGTPPLFYQWRRGASPIGGATSASYSLNPTSVSDNGAQFSVVVSNSFGVVTSAVATLTVNSGQPPVIQTGPTNLTVIEPAVASFSVTASGTVPLSYQWRRGGINIGGATSSTYQLNPTVRSTDNGAQFDVIVSNAHGMRTSAVATLTVNLPPPTPPSIQVPPSSLSVIAPNAATFSVVANGTAPLAYQWRRNGINIGAATGTSYILNPTSRAIDHEAQFSVVVANSAGSVTSVVATVSVVQGHNQPVNWTHLSSAQGDLPVPPASVGQSGLRAVDLDQNGQMDYLLTLWGTPSIVWYRHVGANFEPYVIDSESMSLSHGEKFKDIDSDGDLDLVFGEAGLGSHLYWWENPHPNFEANTPWVRHLIYTGGGFFHDNVWGDFDGDGVEEFISWNLYGHQLLFFEIPANPRAAGPWPVTPIYSWSGNPDKYRGAEAIDINLDGKVDFVGGAGWFEHMGGTSFIYRPIDEPRGYSQIKAGQFIAGGRPEVVCVLELENGPLNLYQWNGSAWQVHTIQTNLAASHTLQVGDINQDGHLDIVTGELGQVGALPENPGARQWVFYGDGAGNFTRQILFLGQGSLESQLADIDNDGDLDLLGNTHIHHAPRVDFWINEGFAPTIAPRGGSFSGQVTVSLSSQAGNAIYYTTDGNAPTTSSTLYTGPFTRNASGTVKAISALSGVVLKTATGTNALSSATFTISPDAAPPLILRAEAVLQPNRVSVLFSEPVDLATAQTTGNYSINNGVSVSAATLDANLRTVHLTTSPLSPGSGYSLVVNNVRDRAGPANTIAPNSAAAFVYQGVSSLNLALWFKADAGVIPNGGAVSQWIDQSGNSRHGVQTGTPFSQPQLRDQALNGLPVVRFDGVNDFFTFPLQVNGLSGMTIFLVAADTANQDGGFTGLENAALFWNETASWGSVSLTPYQSRVRLGFGTTQANSRMVHNRPASVGTSFTLSTALKNGTTDTLFVNGVNVLEQGGKLSTIAASQNTGNLGRGYNDNTYFAGEIAEVLVYTRALTPIERVAVEQYLGGKYALLAPVVVAPQITSHPPSIVITEPASANFTVIATGTGPLGYQWRRGGAIIGGATTSSYTLAPTSRSSDNGAQFDVIVSNTAGSVTSIVATLTVDASGPQGPVIQTQPAHASVIQPNPASFSVVATGSNPLAYQWRRGGVNIGGATSSSYTVNPTSEASDNGAQFDVIVSNGGGSVTSLVANLTVTSLGSLPSAGIALWLRSDAGIVLNGATVTQWLDQSGNNRHATQAAALDQPVTTGPIVNGLPVVRFDGLSDHFTFPMAVNGLTGMSIFLVSANAQSPAPGTQAEHAALFWNESGPWGTIHVAPFQSSIKIRFGTTQEGNEIVYNRPASLGAGFSLTEAIKDGTTDSLYVDGTLAVTQGGKLPAIADCLDIGNVGRGYNDNTFFAGDIAEVLIYSRALSPAERNAVEFYLANKYGLTTPAGILPQIVTPPANVSVTQPAAAVFTTVASGAPPLSYQWRRSGVNLGGETNNSLTLNTTTVAGDNGAQFDVIVSNGSGSVTSTVATLTVHSFGITCASDKAVACGTAWTFDTPNVSDSCGNVGLTVVNTVTNNLGAGNFAVTRTWLATNGCSGQATCSQTVTVSDTTPPSITCSSNKTVQCGQAWTFNPPTTADSCSTVTLTVTSTVTNAGPCGSTFTATRLWRATDSAGNFSECSQVVTVADTTPPTITCVSNKTVQCGTAWTFDAPSASDSCGSVIAGVLSTVTNVGACAQSFTATRTWKAMDPCGNEAMCSQTVTVVDLLPPTLTCVPNKTVQCGSVWNFDAPSASDLCGTATILIVNTVTNAGPCGQRISATRTWKAIDSCNNESTCTQTVTVVDTTAPVLSCAPNKSVECETAWNFDAPSASDSCGSITIVIVGTVTNSTDACNFTATRTWRATDGCNNETVCSQVVTVAIRPQLLIERAGGLIRLSWVGLPAEHVLEMAQDLMSGIWTPVGGTPVVEGGRNVVATQTAAPSRFYRLRRL